MLKASDAFSSYVLNAATGGQFQHRFGLLLAGTAGVAPGLVIILGIVAVIMSAIQAVLLVFRLGAVIVLSGTLPLAAAGQLTPRTKPWLWKVLGWELSLIWYKAAAALVYAAGFALIGTPGSGTIGFLMGIAVLLLSLVALPALMKFFNWTTGELQQSGGGGFLGTAAGAMQAAGAMRSFGMSPSGQASAVNGSLGSAGGGPGGPQPGGPQPGGPQAGGRAGRGDHPAAARRRPAQRAPPQRPGAAPPRQRARAPRRRRAGPRPPAAQPRPGPAAPRAGAGAARPGRNGRHRRRADGGGSRTAARRRRRSAVGAVVTSGQAAPRTYGGWRRRRPVGLLGLGPVGTMVLLGAVILALGMISVSPRAALVLDPLVLGGCGLSLARVGGVPVATAVAVRARWHLAVRRDWPSYRAGIAVPGPGSFQLPGVLAPTMLVSAENGYGGRYGLIWDRHAGYLTATVLVTPASPWLADPGDADAWVAGWGAWLASLGFLPQVRWVTVTVETAPEPGTGSLTRFPRPPAPTRPRPPGRSSPRSPPPRPARPRPSRPA